MADESTTVVVVVVVDDEVKWNVVALATPAVLILAASAVASALVSPGSTAANFAPTTLIEKPVNLAAVNLSICFCAAVFVVKIPPTTSQSVAVAEVRWNVVAVAAPAVLILAAERGRVCFRQPRQHGRKLRADDLDRKTGELGGSQLVDLLLCSSLRREDPTDDFPIGRRGRGARRGRNGRRRRRSCVVVVSIDASTGADVVVWPGVVVFGGRDGTVPPTPATVPNVVVGSVLLPAEQADITTVNDNALARKTFDFGTRTPRENRERFPHAAFAS